MKPPLQPSPPSEEQLDELRELYRTTKDVRLRTRAQMILLAAEQGMTAPAIAQIVRESDQTVRNWFKRYEAEGLKDVPRPGSPKKVTPQYVAKLVEVVRLRPRSLGLPFSMWTLARLADYPPRRTEQTGIRVEGETVRVHLKENEIVLSRPQHKISSPDPEYMAKKRRSKTRAIA